MARLHRLKPAPLVVAMSAAFALPGGFAQDAASAGAEASSLRLPFTLVPSVSAAQTFTRSDAQSPGNPRNEFVTQLSPSVHAALGSGRVRGFVDYALNTLTYARDTDSNNVQQALNAALTGELISNFAFIDAAASISQQSISAAGQQFFDNTLATSNRTEVTTYSVSPYVRGVLGGLVDYRGGVGYSASRSSAMAAADSSSATADLQFSGSTAFRALGWSVTASHQRLDFDAGRANQSDRVDASLSYTLTPQLNVSLHGGRESSDFNSLIKQSGTTSGFGFAWRPSEVTSLTANRSHRAFGDTHSLAFSHRTGRTVWTYTDSRDVASGIGQPLLQSRGTIFDLFLDQASAQQPGADRDLLAQQLSAALLRDGISPNTPVYISFLTSALSIQRRQVFSAALQALRDTFTLSVSQNQSSRLDQVVGVSDPLSSGTLRQQGVSFGWGHRLTPSASLSLNASQQRASGLSGQPGTRLTSVDLSWAAQLGARTRGSLSARRSDFSGGSAYTETALSAGLSLTF